MRSFHFRLDPVMRLKRYDIERMEEEIAEMEKVIRGVLDEIENQRQAVQDMRASMISGESDAHLLQAEQAMDVFRTYLTRLDAQKRAEVLRLRQDQSKKREELIKLYQEEKILERLREKRQQEWQQMEQREDHIRMDEIGSQRFTRRERESGGVLIYLLVPLALIATIGIVGYNTGYIDRSMLENIPILGERLRSATDTVQIASATEPVGEYLTLEEFLGDPQMPMSELLQGIANARQEFAQREKRLREWEEELNRREQSLNVQSTQVAGLVQQVSDQTQVLLDLRQQMEERQKSALSEREQAVADMISGTKAKAIAPMIVSLYQGEPTDTPEEIEEKRKILLRVMHKFTKAKTLTEIISALAAVDPNIAGDLMRAYVKTGEAELYNITTKSADQTVSAPNLAPPQLIDEMNNN